MIKKRVNKLLKKVGYRCIKYTTYEKLLNKSIEVQETTRFSLNTGERQVGINIEEIRKDHVYRYEVVFQFLLQNYADTSVLHGGDIFCGNGYGSSYVAKNTSCYMTGIDASEEAIHLANQYYANEKTYFITKFFPFKIPENIFDFIISFETIEHLVDDVKLIDEFTHSIKSGGYLFISAPNEEICSFEKNNYSFHIKHYTFDDIINCVTKTGKFELITWYGNGAYDFEDGIITGKRNDDEMKMKKETFDSHLIYIFKKKSCF